MTVSLWAFVHTGVKTGGQIVFKNIPLADWGDCHVNSGGFSILVGSDCEKHNRQAIHILIFPLDDFDILAITIIFMLHGL